MDAHPEWNGKLRALMINQGGSDSGLAACSEKATLPLMQDAADKSLWTALAGEYNIYVLYGKNGELVQRFTGVSLPASETPMAETINAYLNSL